MHIQAHTYTDIHMHIYSQRDTRAHQPPGPADPQGDALAQVYTHTPGHRITPDLRAAQSAGCCQAPVCPQGVCEWVSTPGHTPGLAVPAAGTLIPQFGNTNRCSVGAADNWGTHSAWQCQCPSGWGRGRTVGTPGNGPAAVPTAQARKAVSLAERQFRAGTEQGTTVSL